MFPTLEQEMLFGKISAIQDLLRIAYNAEGDNRAKLFAVAVDMINELSALLAAKAPEMEEDDE